MLNFVAVPEPSTWAMAARAFTGGSGTARVVFTQQYAAEAGTNPLYPFYTSLTGSLGVVQAGLGTSLLQPSYGPNTFTGPVTVTSGTLATSGTAAALAGTTLLNVLPGAALALEPASLLSIWNYSGTNDYLNITTGTAFGDLANVRFFSDSGTTFLGYGGFESTRLVPVAVPEPSAWALALGGLACGCWMLRRQKAAGGPRLSSLS